MEKHIYDENNGLTNTLHGDYYLPDLAVSEEETENYGKYGMLRKSYLKEHKPWRYQSMILSGKLNTHFNEVDWQARDRVETLVQQMAEKQDVTEELREEKPILWVQKVNILRNMV